MNAIPGILAGLLALLSTAPVYADGDPDAGKNKAAACAACHAADGNSAIADNPKLAGQNARYLFKQLDEFKDGTRKNAIMNGMAAGLTEQDMHDLAAYFSSQPTKPGQADGDFVELGRTIYRGGIKETGVGACMACHGADGKGNPPAGFPALAGQHSQYVVKALQEFQRGDRVNDPNKMMRLATFKMTQREMKAVAEYIAGLQP